MSNQVAEESGRAIGSLIGSLPSLLPYLLFWFLLASSKLSGADLAWFIAVLIVLAVECGIMIMDWIKPKRTSSDIPNVWFERLAHAVGRAGLVIYCAWAFFRVDSGFFAGIKAALAHLDFSSAFVWVPCLTWAILLVNAAYAIPMGVRYRVGPNQPGDIIGAKIGASLWLAGTAALLWFHAFTPQPFIVEQWVLGFLHFLFSPFLLWPDDPAAAHFVVTWLYLGVILRHAAKLAVLLRGEGGAARGRAEAYVEHAKERDAWQTGND